MIRFDDARECGPLQRFSRLPFDSEMLALTIHSFRFRATLGCDAMRSENKWRQSDSDRSLMVCKILDQ